MNQPIARSNSDSGLLNYVRQGMDVFDVNEKKIGTVTFVKFADANAVETSAEHNDPANLVDVVRGVVAEEDEMPDELESRLLRQGYLRVDGGMLASDRFAMSNQIALVTEHRVELTIPEEELISL